MGRPPRATAGGVVYHVLNRANFGLTLFAADRDYATFAGALTEALGRRPMRLLAYCLVPDSFALLLWPSGDGDLSAFMRTLTLVHTLRWHADHKSTGSGHVYQGRFRSFPVQPNEHFLTVCRHLERGGMRAGLVARAQDWRWSSLWQRQPGNTAPAPSLSRWPVAAPTDWTRRVNTPLRDAEIEAVERSLERGQPFGGQRWQATITERLGLESTFRPRGRPRKNP
jgi:putative transposase